MDPNATITTRWGRPLSEAANRTIGRFANTTSGIVKKVKDFFVIQFHELGGDFELGRGQTRLPGLFLPTANPIEQLFHRPRNDAHILFVGVGDLEPRAHGVGLAGAGLTIGQDSGIEPAIENMEIIIGSWKLGTQWVVSGNKHVLDAFGYILWEFLLLICNLI